MFKNNFKDNFKSKFKNMTWRNMAHPSSQSWLRGLALSHVYRLTLVRCTKSTFVLYLSRLLTQNWCKLDIDSDNLESNTNKHDDWNLVFAHHKEEDKIYPLTLTEIADAQCKDQELKVYFRKNTKMPQKDIDLQHIEGTKELCKNGKVMILTSLRHRAVSWYHHYLQHPGHSRLEETMRSVMYWKGMRTTIRRHIKTCHSCQVNKRHSQKYGHLPPKLVITTPWKALCVDLIGPYTLNSLTAIGPYMAYRFSWALLELHNFLNFCLFSTFKSSKCS